MSFYPILMQTLTILGVFGSVASVALLVAHLSGSGRAALRRRFAGQAVELIGWGGAVALVATLGSLFLSEVVGFTPCVLCWYQRIAMYPLAVILGIAALRSDIGVRRYVVPLLGVGAALSTYHYLMQHFPELSASSCSASAPCTAAWVWEFGFVSIPFMALACFATIAWLLLAGREHATQTN